MATIDSLSKAIQGLEPPKKRVDTIVEFVECLPDRPVGERTGRVVARIKNPRHGVDNFAENAL